MSKKDGEYGHMVALTPEGVAPVKIVEAIDQIRTVSPNSELVRVGQALGISFGNCCEPARFNPDKHR